MNDIRDVYTSGRLAQSFCTFVGDVDKTYTRPGRHVEAKARDSSLPMLNWIRLQQVSSWRGY